MAGRLDGKVALITGAGSSGPGWGNGKATAVLFAREGARILAADLNLAAAEETAALVAAEGGEALAHQADVAERQDITAMVEACLARFGRIDVLHNSVGIAEVGGVVEASEESWDRVMDVNLKSMFLTCKAVIPVMVEQGAGAIVNVSSVAGIRWLGVPYISYQASKAAVIQFTRTIAVEYAKKGLRANSILPGFMNTPMIRGALMEAYGGNAEKMIELRDALCPTGEMGDAWDVAYAALYLASDEARYVTATELVVDGGLTARCV